MPQYQYYGLNETGKSIKGQIIADNLGSAKNQLRSQGIYPSQILESIQQEKGASEITIPFFTAIKKIKTEDLSIMTRQLATLVSAHVPLAEALQALTEQVDHPRLRATIAKVKTDVNEGMALHQAFARFPDLFSDLYVNMVKSGETSGALDIVLQRLADFLEYQDRLKKKIASALLYPLIMMSVSIILLLFIFTTVIPQLESIFEENKATLPLITRMVLGISRFTLSYWWLVLALFIVGSIGFKKFLKTPTGKQKRDEMELKLPLFGNLIRMIAISRFTKTLGTLLRNGIPLLTSLKVVKNVVGNNIILQAIDQAITELTEGQSIAKPLEKSGQFPPLVTHMIRVGERTGELENMLDRVATHYEYQVDTRIQTFTSLIEPIMILFLAMVVGTIVVSVILPMLNLNEIAL